MNPPRNKTGRRYGAVYRLILERAARGPFSVSELSPPLRPDLASLNCRHLAKSGRLRCVRAGETGRNRPRARYALP